MDDSNQTKINIENALAEFIKLKTNKSEDEVVNLSKKFLSQLDEKLSNKTSTKEIFKHLQELLQKLLGFMYLIKQNCKIYILTK